MEDRPKEGPDIALAVGRARPRPRSGGAGKLALGGAAGLIVGTLVGGIAAAIVALKSAKKLLTMPFR